MDTAEVAQVLGTTPRLLRQFLRSDYSTFQAVGSGARYDFTDKDVPTLTRRFSDWRKDGKPQPNGQQRARVANPKRSTPKADKQHARDQQEWNEEGTVVLDDIRDPRVRARVRRDAEAAEARLMTRLAAHGLHIFQLGDPRVSATEKKPA